MRLSHLLRRSLGLCLLAGTLSLGAQTGVQVLGGDPFGVCVVRANPDQALSRDAGTGSWAELEASLLDAGPGIPARALYPVAMGPGSMAFLFKGDEPFELPGGTRVPVSRDETLRRELLQTWWQAYLRQAQGVVAKDVYEPVLETYLTSMLSRRLDLKTGGMRDGRGWKSASVDDLVGLLLGTESIRLAMQRQTMLDSGASRERADQPLPEAAAPPAMPVPAFDERQAVVEPLAFRVPKECFYLRASSHADFVWLRRMLDEWGGAFRNLLATRGADYQVRTRLERQLALRETALGRQFGGLAVGDVALIGTDTFFREGSALGVLFHAKNNPMLARHLAELRRQAQQEDPSLSSETVRIGGRECSLLSRSDHAVRSFYVADGDFHLVTNSRWIVEGFLKTASDRSASLGSLKEFQFARSRVPVARQDPAFLYLSDPFFRNLVGPAYRVEMTRRAQSSAELAVAAVARLAARAEGVQGEALPQLIQGGFLPPGFGSRVDGTSLEVREGRYIDSLRGGQGTFLPVPDVPIAGLTASEVEAYRRFTQAYARLWTRTDPVFGAISRRAATKGLERVTLELHISPYAKATYGIFDNFLGQAAPWQLGGIKGDVLSAELIMKEQPRSSSGTGTAAKDPRQLNRLFGGLRDFAIPFHIQQGDMSLGQPWGRLFETSLRGYIGQYKPAQGGLADFLFRGVSDEVDAHGYAPQEERGGGGSGLWTRTFGDFLVTGIDRKTLEDVTPQMKLQKAPRPAQLRLVLGDLGASRFAPFLTAQLYTRDRRISAANAMLLQHLGQQLHVAPQDALATAETLLGQRLTCPLGGQYRLTPSQRWVSTAWAEDRLGLVAGVPSGYRHPGLDWLHGAALEFSIDPQALQTRFELLIDPAKLPASARKE